MVHQVPTGIDLLALDHVALAVADPVAMAAFLCGHVGMQELARNADRIVVGAGDGAATVVLIEAEGPRSAGSLERLVLRVADVERAIAALAPDTEVEGDRFELAAFEGPEGLPLGFTFVAGGGIDLDLDHVLLRLAEPEPTRLALAAIGFMPRGEALHVADKYIGLAASPVQTQRPLLDHLAVRVDSVEAVAAQVRERGDEIDEDANPDVLAIVLPGPERLVLRFV